MKIGIVGGTFDPVHNGHINLVKELIKKLQLDKVIVVVASVSPFKVDSPQHANAHQRYQMVKLAFEGIDNVEVSSIEVDRGGVSYTIDTVNTLLEAYQKEDLILMFTQDAIDSFDRFKDSKEIDAKVQVVFAVDEKKPIEIEDKEICPIHWFSCSSTMIRERLAKKECCKEFLSPKVLDYIAKHQLYSRAYDNG